MKIQREWATPITIGAFGLLAVTGVLMFFHLDSGLNKTAHEWLGWVLLGGVAAHLAVNLPAFKRHLTAPRGRAVMAAFALVLGLSFVPLGGASDGPPFKAPIQSLAAAPVPVLAQVAGVSTEAMRQRLAGCRPGGEERCRHRGRPGRQRLRRPDAAARPRAGAGQGDARVTSRALLPALPMSATEFKPGLFIRDFAPPLRLADYKLVAFDMDSTLINIECVDEIAAVAGRKDEVAAITEAAMRGEITDYKDSLRRRVALLAGVPEAALQQVYEQRLRLNPGVEAFVEACQAAGLKTLLVSGGFTFFSERIRHRLKLDFARANSLGVSRGKLTGTLFDRPWGDICDGAEKRRVVLEVCELMGIDTAQAIAVGDGANDLPMMNVAGLSIAYHGKPAVREQAMISIEQGGMERALEVLHT